MVYYTYLLRCRDDSLYAGITTDVARRLAEHRAGGAKGARYTRLKGAVLMAAVWQSDSRSDATRLEARLKRANHETKEQLTLHPEQLSTLLFAGEPVCYRPAPLPLVEPI